MKEDLQSRLKSVILSIGDIVVDCINSKIKIIRMAQKIEKSLSNIV